jgi:CRISPR-associated protein Csb2
MLRLDINWLMGTAWLARGPASPLPDWPPEPDRIFSALVASWGAGGELAEERAALEWLEACAPPLASHPAAVVAREAPTVFVPPNDATSADITILPSRRRRQPRHFPAVSLDIDDAQHLSLFWTADAPTTHLDALNELAFRTSHVGHSSSVVRCQFVAVDEVPDGAKVTRRAPYPGRLAELEALHARHMAGDERARARPSQRAGVALTSAADPAAKSSNSFAEEPAQWIMFMHAGGERPDLRAAAILGDAMRMALMRAWTSVHGEPPPAWISGHEPDRSPARDAHLAVVPLGYLGFQRADGRLMGLALVPPRAITEGFMLPGPAAFRARQAFAAAIAALGEADPRADNGDGPVLTLAPRGGGWSWRIRPADGGIASLDPRRYLGTSRSWASATPVLLDRHLKKEGAAGREEAAEIVARACARIGLPLPDSIDILKHAAISGAPSAWPSGGNPRWMNWSRKASFGDRKLCHVRLTFKESVAGPVLIGAARFTGLGLCLPVAGDLE